jgi:hypothetical protein
VFWEKCITASPSFKEKVIEINYSRYSVKSNDLLKTHFPDGTNYLDFPIHPITHGIKLQKMYLLWKMLNGGSEYTTLAERVELMIVWKEEERI